MPHFFAKSLDSLESVKNRSGEYFDFILEAVNVRDKSALILAQNKSDSEQKIMLLKQQKNDKFLVKFIKHFKVQSREAIKNALKDYAKLTNADIIAHNLNANKVEAQSKYLLDSRGILGLFGESKDLKDLQNVGESDSIDSCESSESRESCFKNATKMVEIGFGSGRHILNLAQNNPNALIIGLEIYRPAILQVLRQIELLGLQNLYLASIDARVLFEVLPRESLSAIFLHFPVPWDKNPQRRVFSEVFLANVIRTLNPQNGRFELITDSKEYFDFAKKLARIYKHKITINPQNKVVSKYEARWKRLKKDIYKLEIFPQIKDNLFLGNHLNYFGTKFRSMDAQVLFSSFRAKIIQSTTAITSIVIRVANQLRIKRESVIFRHCEVNRRFAEAIQNFCDSKNDKNQIARSATLKALSGAGVGVVREGEGSDFAIQAPTPSLKENARGQKGEFNADLSAESCKEIDSNVPLDSQDSFSQKGCTPRPAPPTRQKLPLFAFRGRASLSPILAKNRHSHYCSFESDFLHHESGEIRGASHDLFNLDCFGDELPRNDESSVDCFDSATPNLAMTDKGDSQKLGFLPPKICKKEYFLQIKDKYEFGDGFVIYVVFGAYYAPNSAYIIVRKNSKYCEILGDIIPTKANLSALNELQFLGSYA